MTPATILIVDDSKAQCALYQDLFQPDYHVLASHDGSQALELLATHRPDLILLDIQMPGLDGYAVCEQLRRHGYDMPVIFVSAGTSLEQRLRAYDAGGNDFVGKPVSDAELRHKVAMLLRQREEEQRLRQDGQQAFATAMTAMTTMSEMGVLIDFLRQCAQQETPAALAHIISRTLQAYDLQGCLQLSTEQGDCQYATHGPVTPLESSIIASALSLPRIASSGNSTTFNYPYCCIIIRDMPSDEERSGRLRDHLAILAEAASNRIRQQDNILQQLRTVLPAACRAAALDEAQQTHLMTLITHQWQARPQG